MQCNAIFAGDACEAEGIMPGDNFCWLCGTPVIKELQVPSRAIPAIEEPVFKSCQECGSTFTNERGICRKCGIRSRPPLRENFYIRVGPDLAARSHVGIKHADNDDYAITTSRIVNDYLTRWFIVCDGLSQSQHGKLAAEAACKAASLMIELMIIDGKYDPQSVISNAVRAAQSAVLEVPEDPAKPAAENGTPYPRAMTTIVIALVSDDPFYSAKVYIGWVGDSRIYAIYSRDGKCGARRLTTDDSRLEQMRADGVSYKDASQHPRAGEMTQTLGPIPESKSLIPHYAELPTLHVAAVVGATDGAYSYFDPGPDPETGRDKPQVELAQAYVDCQGEALALLETLTANANSRGGHDNITTAAIFLQPTSS
jgi:PPM family protein phosphatase